MHNKDYWEKQVALAVKIAKKYGYADLDTEFWNCQPAVSIRLITDLFNDIDTLIEWIGNAKIS